MTIIFPVVLIVMMIVVLAVRMGSGLWSNLVMLGNIVVAALIAMNFFELLAGLIVGAAGFTAYYADFISIWVIFAITLMILKAITDIASRIKVRFPKPVETVGNLLLVAAIGWILVCFTTMTFHLAPLGREAVFGGFKPENPSFFGFSPDRMWMGFVQRESEGTLSSANIFDAKGDFMVRYAVRRERLDRPDATGS